MSLGQHEWARLRQLILSTHAKPQMETLKRMVRKWQSPRSTGQDAVNRAMVRALDELHNRIDVLLKV